MKKTIVILLAVILSTALIGCSGGPAVTPTQAPATAAPSGTTGSGTTSAPPQSNEVKYPLSDGSITLKWWIPLDTNLNFLNSYNEHIVYQELMKKTGVNIEFLHPAIGQVKEEFSLLMASGELPDIIQTFDNNYNGGVVAGLEDGVILDLTEYIPQYAPDYYKCITESDSTFRQFSTQDGRIAAFYTFWEDINPPAACITLRGDWLRQFGLKAEDMTTYSAVEKYFQGIVDNYPDVAPLYINITNPVYYYGFNITPDWYQIDGEAVHFSNQDNYRGFLELMSKWYDKGYISKDFASYTANGARSLFSAGKIGCFQEPIGNVYSDAQASGVEFAKSPYWRLEEGQDINVYFPSGSERNGGQCTVVTSACKNVKEAVMLLNYGFTDAGLDLTNWGVEGVSYTVQSNGSYKYTDLVINNKDYGTAVTHQLYRIHWIANRKLPDTVANPNIIKDEELVALRMLYNTGDPHLDGKYKMPSGATLTTDENAKRSSIMSNVNTYVNEMRLKFITGTVKLNDASWQEYLNTLKSMKLDEAVSISQAALDRYLGKK